MKFRESRRHDHGGCHGASARECARRVNAIRLSLSLSRSRSLSLCLSLPRSLSLSLSLSLCMHVCMYVCIYPSIHLSIYLSICARDDGALTSRRKYARQPEYVAINRSIRLGVCVCVCVRERERERESARVGEFVCATPPAPSCVCNLFCFVVVWQLCKYYLCFNKAHVPFEFCKP